MCKDPLHLIYTKMNPTNSALESPSSPQNKQLGLFFFFFFVRLNLNKCFVLNVRSSFCQLNKCLPENNNQLRRCIQNSVT